MNRPVKSAAGIPGKTELARLILLCGVAAFQACQTKSVESGLMINLDLERRVVFSEIKNSLGFPYDFANAVELGPNGSVYLRDVQTGVVLKIGSDGKLLKTIGRPGQGPGEFQSRSGPYYVDPQGNLYVLDQTRLVKFDIEGEYVRDIPAVWSIDGFFVGPGDVVICTKLDRSENHPTRALQRIKEGIVETIRVFPDEATTSNQGVHLSIRAPDSGLILIRSFPDQGFCLADNRNFSVYFYDREAASLGEVRMERKKIPLNAEEAAKIMRAMEYLTKNAPGFKPEIPKYKVFFHQLIVDEKERLYFLRKENRDRVALEIYTRKGLPLGWTELPFLPLAVRDDTLYSLDSGADGELLGLSRWKIRNPDVLIPRR
jgi:hypothetical protein